MIKNIIIDDLKPLLQKVGKTDAVFETNNTTYNETGYTYNQAGWTYGGADRISDRGGQMELAVDIKPSMVQIINDN